MVYEETVIDGVLCFRLHKFHRWEQLSKEALTAKIIYLRSELYPLTNQEIGV